MAKFVLALAGLVAVGAAAFYVVTEPDPITSLPDHKADVANGEMVFWAGGCASCHADKDAKGADRLKLAGGQAFKTQFGTFYAPNISSDTVMGIGTWTPLQLVNALKRGLSPEGEHLYPALPYTSYARMKTEDIIDLAAFLKTVPPISVASKPNDVPFPFNIRRTLGGWKFLFLNDRPVVDVASASDEVKRGAYLVEGPGHCSECHTPRNLVGAVLKGKWLGGAPDPEGKGRVPNITPAGIGSWSAGDIAEYLSSGMTPDGDFAGGNMSEVISNMAHLSDGDRKAIGAYLKTVAPVTQPPD